ncbi:putative S-locus-specific glycoprotein S6 precursor [Corchorus olitorius]|uniref:S-locus-specific glycoprotein S6 n=1 Tax=Corchorus olitorius TaxID=93759 RepID=A0A1R3H3V7_9ROSI|nr:putative S-locus-specific glycoprotein S6 precursor [Corchorus olitorius]
MKLGWNKKTGLNRHLTSWKSSDDPSPGEYTYGVDPRGLPQLVLRKDSVVQFRSGPWYGTQFSGVPVLQFKEIDVIIMEFVVIMVFVTLTSPPIVNVRMGLSLNHPTIGKFLIGQVDVYGKIGVFAMKEKGF